MKALWAFYSFHLFSYSEFKLQRVTSTTTQWNAIECNRFRSNIHYWLNLISKPASEREDCSPRGENFHKYLNSFVHKAESTSLRSFDREIWLRRRCCSMWAAYGWNCLSCEQSHLGSIKITFNFMARNSRRFKIHWSTCWNWVFLYLGHFGIDFIAKLWIKMIWIIYVSVTWSYDIMYNQMSNLSILFIILQRYQDVASSWKWQINLNSDFEFWHVCKYNKYAVSINFF